MKIGFEKPVGSHADVKECEYISALHQTCVPLRKNGSIDADDIIALLHSRFGLEVTSRQAVEEEVLVELAGDPKPIPSHVLDLRQAVALLLLPHLVKCAQGPDHDDILVIESIVDEIHAEFGPAVAKDNPDKKLCITEDFVRDLLAAHSEMDVSEELIGQMVEVAGGEGVEFTAKSFLRALTQDLGGYNLEWENRLSTTFTDVLGAKPPIPMGREGGLVRRSSSIIARKSANSATSASAKIRYSNVSTSMGGNEEEQPVHLTTGASFAEAEGEPELCQGLALKANKVLILAGIDNTADLYGSQTFAILQWCAFLILFVAFVYGNDRESGGIDAKCDVERFGCKFANAILDWLAIFVQLVVLGSAFFLSTSIANSTFLTHSLISIARVIIGMAGVFVLCIMPEFTAIDTWFFNTDWRTQSELFELFGISAVCIGAILLLLLLQALVRLLVPFNILQNNESLRRWLEPGTLEKDLNTKRAAAFKTNKMVQNALSLHGTSTTANADNTHSGGRGSPQRTTGGLGGQAMSNYLARQYEMETTGSILQAWKGFYTGTLCYEEGIWFHTRLLASALVQFMVIVVMMSFFASALWEVGQAYAVARGDNVYCSQGGCITYGYINETTGNFTPETPPNDGPTFEELLNQSVADAFQSASPRERAEFIQEIEQIVFNASGVNVSSPEFEAYHQDGVYGAISAWFVENAKEEDVNFAMAIGFTFSILSTVWILFGYTPSFAYNVMKYRYGVVPSLYSSDFQLYRNAPDHATLVFGMAFWAQLFTSFFAFVIPGFMAFILVWDETKSFVQGLLAQLLGIAVTLLLKVLIMVILRNVLIAGFYRKKLAATNLLFVLLECWNIALSAGFLVGRTAIFILCGIFYVGRIDTPFLSPGVDRFDALPRVFLDRAPVCYRKDLLVHEAHRHPYIDRLAGLYLLKLNLGASFATRAGSCWRLLFVLALMPWVRKYKVRPEIGDDAKGTTGRDEEEGGPLADAPNRGRSLRESVLEEEVVQLRAQTVQLQAQLDRMQTQKSSLAPFEGEIEKPNAEPTRITNERREVPLAEDDQKALPNDVDNTLDASTVSI